MMVESMEGDRTGLQARLDRGMLGFKYDTIILIAKVRRSMNSARDGI